MACDKTGIDLITQIDDRITALEGKEGSCSEAQDLLLGEVYNVKREVVNSGSEGDALKNEVIAGSNEVTGLSETAISSTDGMLECIETIDELCGDGFSKSMTGAASSAKDALNAAEYLMGVLGGSQLASALSALGSVASKYLSKLLGSGILDDILSLDSLFTCAEGFPNVDPDELQERMDKVSDIQEKLWISDDGTADESYIDQMTIEAGGFADDIKSTLTSSLTSSRQSVASAAGTLQTKTKETVGFTKEATKEVTTPPKNIF